MRKPDAQGLDLSTLAGLAERGVIQVGKASNSWGKPNSADKNTKSSSSAKVINAYQYDMRGRAEQCIQRYLDVAKVERKP